MSTNLGEVGKNNVGAFCGPEGRRESYQIDGPEGWIQFTYEEWTQIKDKIEARHADYVAQKR